MRVVCMCVPVCICCVHVFHICMFNMCPHMNVSVCICVCMSASACVPMCVSLCVPPVVFSFFSLCVYCMNVCAYLCICVYVCICPCCRCLCVHVCLCKAPHMHASASACCVHACVHAYLYSLCVSNVSVCLCCIADTQGGVSGRSRNRVGSRVSVIPQILASLPSSDGSCARLTLS